MLIYQLIKSGEENKNKVSVIMSTYNTNEKFLKKSIESILKQTHTNFEFIIVNDGGKKDIEIIKQYKDKRIKIIENEENEGLPSSLNKALKISTGKYIARMDSDDIAVENRLEKQVIYMESHKDIDICGMFAKQIGKGKRYSLTPLYNSEEVKLQLYFKCALTHPTVMIRKEFLDKNKLKYNENFKYAQDYELWSKCNMITKISIIPMVGLYLRIHDKQISTEKKEQQNSYYIDTLRNNVSKLGINEEIIDTLTILNGKEKLKKDNIDKFCIGLEQFEVKVKDKKMKKIINSTLCNLYIKNNLFNEKIKIENLKLKRRIYNMQNLNLLVKRIILILKCKILLLIK